MRIPKKNHELIRQNEKTVKKSQKHDANLQKNSTLYFQVGLIVVLLAVYGLFEMKFETHIPKVADVIPPNEILVSTLPVFKPKVIVSDKPVSKKVNNPTNKYEKVPDDTPDIFIDDTPEPKTQSEPILDPGNVSVVKIDEDVNIPINFVEVVPVYPGCEKAKNNDERRACMSDKINKLIQKKFNGDIASEYGLTGVQRISVLFKIDKTGHVSDIEARAPHTKLQEEAERVVNEIPNMQPGMQRDKPVGVIYALPILFKVQN